MLFVSHTLVMLASVLSISRDSGDLSNQPHWLTSQHTRFWVQPELSPAQAWHGLLLGIGKGDSSKGTAGDSATPH